MGYPVKEDLYEALSESVVKKYCTDPGVANEDETIVARIDNAIAKAIQELEGYLRGRYSLPLSSVPDNLKAYCTDIALYNCASRKGIKPGTSDELLERKYKNALRFLERVQDGKADIAIPNDEGESSPPSKVAYTAPKKVFGETFFKGF